jgi:hypothetical protein
MSLTSCYRYILELPVAALAAQIKAAIKENDGAGIIGSLHWTDLPVGGRTATVDAHFEDPDAHPPGLTLGAPDLSAKLSLAMSIEIQINDIPGLGKIIYSVTFDFPGSFEKEASVPPRLTLKFPAVTAGDLNLAVSGGAIPLSPELLEPKIHAIYQVNPSLGHDVQDNVPFPGVSGGVRVTTDVYDDAPPGLRVISVQVTGPAQFKIIMPGHFKVTDPSHTYMDTDMKIEVLVAVQQNDGEIRAKLSNVQSSDVTVTFVSSSSYDVGAKFVLSNQMAAKLRSFGDQSEPMPTNAEIQALITERLLATAPLLVIPVFTPSAPNPGEIDLTTFVPTTVNQQVLALQLVPRNDGTPCDPPDVFAGADGFAVAIAKVEVDSMLQPLLDASKGDRTAGGYDMTVTRLDGRLSDPGEDSQARGHIWIDGNTEVHVDCWPDPDVHFWGPIFLKVEKKQDGTLVFTADAGGFDADNPCCGDVDPAQIAQLIQGEQSAPIALPNSYTGVGEINLNVAEDADIFKAGVVVDGTLDVVTTHALQGQTIRRAIYWATEPSSGG